MEEINTPDLPRGIAQSLTAKVQAAINSFGQGQNEAGNNQLNAFINSVQAQRGKKIPADLADLFIAKVQDIIALH